ncbi:MAG TPA: RluA family pseudouridine synthase [Candidatus Saccharimonadales bacterium]|nr:RluA family pseudouridine synthase [Candidatus Saccharimonadales bacterium]
MNLIEADRRRYSAYYHDRKGEIANRQVVEDWIGTMNGLGKDGRLSSAGTYSLASWKLFNSFEEHILYQDEDVLAINKPAWVISGSGDGQPEAGVVEIAQYFSGDVVLVNRLDRPTSGVIVLAKNEKAFAGVFAQFERTTGYQMSKVYRAILEGQPRVLRTQFIDAELMPIVGGKMKFVPAKRPGTTPSRTIFNPLSTFESASGKPRTFAEFELLTGRTHQIRVVAAEYLGFPVCGDPLYDSGARDRDVPRLMLHSFSTTFMHPILSKELTISAALPQDFAGMLPSGMSA